MEIRRVRADEYDTLLELLNVTFGNHNKKETHFDRDLPAMWKRDDEHMGKHFAAFEDGRMVAALGVYPLPVKILGEELLFSTMGNVATHPDFEGRGYMKALMKYAMAELENIGADASRLGGKRARYGRYGYEMCGIQYKMMFTPHNLKNYFPDFKANITFERLERDNSEALEFCCDLYDSEKFFVVRGKDDNYFGMYSSMVAWQNVPYVARDGKGNFVGFLSVKGNEIAEIFATTPEIFRDMILSWAENIGDTVNFCLREHNIAQLRILTPVCEKINIVSPSHFKIMNYKKVIGALLKLKADMCPLTEADFTINILTYGKLRIVCDSDGARCEDYEGECDITLDRNGASRFLFGPLPAYAVADTSVKMGNILPLPLSWNLQDRV
ncbi:MAG: GNAT family N-acetyltransferase [Clostridia bacterium]|nr:GNAT family N-acetyltransferase [Clostridia bacterium]